MNRDRSLATRIARTCTVAAAMGIFWGAAPAQTPPAATPPAASNDPTALIKKNIEQRYPDIHVQQVRAAGVAGLFEVYTGAELVYSDARGDFIVMGPIVNTATHENLTQERLSDIGRIDFKALPFKEAIKVVKGNGTRQFAVFSDPDCPYCQALEKNLVALNDYTMYVFLFPIAQLHPQAPAKAHSLWCAPDRTQAWSQWMLEKKLPPTKATCAGDPIDSLQQLADQLHVNSTPTLFFTSGRRVAGAISAKDIEKEMAAAPGGS